MFSQIFIRSTTCRLNSTLCRRHFAILALLVILPPFAAKCVFSACLTLGVQSIKHCGFPTDGMIPFLGFGSRLSALSCRPSLGRSARFLYGPHPMIDHQTVSPMFCPACGHARTPDAKICEKCRERLQV